MYEAIEQHLRLLHSLDEDTSRRQIVLLILSKLPKVFAVCLEQQKWTQNEWTVEILRKILKRYITAQEIGENQFRTNSRDDENLKTHGHKVRYCEIPFRTISYLMSSDRCRKPKPNCFYCRQLHWSDFNIVITKRESQRKMLHMSSSNHVMCEI